MKSDDEIEKVLNEIKKLLNSIGAAVYVMGTIRHDGNSDDTIPIPGVSGLLLCWLPDRRIQSSGVIVSTNVPVLLFVQCMAKDAEMSPEQRIFRRWCHAAHVHHVVGDQQAVIQWLIDQRMIAATHGVRVASSHSLDIEACSFNPRS